ncbi:acetyl-CoA carboxylase biotin carboxylase subunit [Billgrantia endophytica]|uniref:Biotin carboxylase n=2 Tax=Billgrantia endophytica TaxID=2033802 RepID=A0A2N7TVX1_9GAMM|nr:acetyl-CoA carboxylase biotin carboxylase subunit [Halomonas endophytica]
MNHKILIANRGEIACRIIDTCQRLSLSTVAVYSDADKDARHVEMADQAVAIGPAQAAKSYLDAEAIFAAARETGATVIHPGYGFLSESGNFARRVRDEGLLWVGPAPNAIDAMGDKERAREIAISAGVPVLPGSRRFRQGDMDGLHEAAEQVGYPLLVKAAAGGGGIGMRRVDAPDDIEAVVEATQSMSSKAFGDSSIYLERYVAEARHVEVQVFGFGNGEGLHLYDRDCSVQRRFQKIIEEAPAPNIPEKVRNKLYQAALALVRHQQYSGAGTVEFIYDRHRQSAYFLEMNTRIQVEHPATEMVTGVDLVEWQLRQALGELPVIAQGLIHMAGHAIECRLYAERPEKNFLPAPGNIKTLVWPMLGEFLRIDTGVRSGDQVTPYYDPLMAKIIAHGADREEAIANLSRALEEVVVEGLHNNSAFLSNILRDFKFKQGGVTTGYVDDFFARQSVASITDSP